MLQYNKARGRVYNGLTRRRKAEQKLFITPVKKKSNKTIAKEVLAGKWGNNPERKKKLIAAGYDYEAIRKIVNKLAK